VDNLWIFTKAIILQPDDLFVFKKQYVNQESNLRVKDTCAFY